jgi:hypothetical protein
MGKFVAIAVTVYWFPWREVCYIIGTRLFPLVVEAFCYKWPFVML